MTRRRTTLVQIRREELDAAIADAAAVQIGASANSIAEPIPDTIPEGQGRAGGRCPTPPTVPMRRLGST